MPIAKILKGQNVPIKIWTTDIEEEAEKQLYNMATLPFLYKHIAVMGDVHWGNGSCVGSVIATKGAISPAFCGVDIGCGMMAVKLDINKDIVLDKLKELRHSIERSIPVGFNSNKEISESVAEWYSMEYYENRKADDLYVQDKSLIEKSKHQLGTLGGGNHFIEICLDTNGAIWVMLHSGSRNIGKTIADIYIEKAKVLMDKYFIKLADPNLAYLAKETQEFDNYINDLHWCQDYAMANRQEMMSRVLKDIAYMFNDKQPINKLMEVNCHHNYTEIENHYGENVYITRKGAVRARIGDFGIIPGSMGTGSFIVRGLGNRDSFNSCSHGAGRRMSRKAANKLFTLKDVEEQTKGIECRKDEGIIDELPGAYKDINSVMKDQEDLVEIVAELHQVICIKG